MANTSVPIVRYTRTDDGDVIVLYFRGTGDRVKAELVGRTLAEIQIWFVERISQYKGTDQEAEIRELVRLLFDQRSNPEAPSAEQLAKAAKALERLGNE